MSKRRITLSLDEEVVEALEAISSVSLSASANVVLREGLELAAHRAAALRWLEQLDSEHGAADNDQVAAAEAYLDAIDFQTRTVRSG